MPDTEAPWAGARLLPWPGQEGSPAFLAPHGGETQLAALADEVEQLQPAAGAEVLRCARPLIAEPAATVREVRFAAIRLAECLSDALRVAESRCARLALRPPGPNARTHEDSHGQVAADDQETRQG
ncbi:hypothetical protein RM780_04850 [Streptomyces sp. DSM 44917]|uniref:Uncharacterized protein n=1 Tax=Streptomyces boetiae TaxID=3075541 RepID=A0ABU2L401_9ACTN|nr:hypothetical protein [Streptomyces sp. DSM 44917]MDT0306291.1 hypothetical protein [Streptomyces sp. DSM 44917]